MNYKSVFLLIRVNLPKGIAVCLSPVIFSCTSINISPDVNAFEQVKAENRVMKQTITLTVRENSILKEENIRYKSETGKLKARVKLLESEIESLHKKHEQDVALLNDRYDNLNKKNLLLAQESSARIKELSDINKELKDRLTGEITRLNDYIRNREEKFNTDRAEIETAFSLKEQGYQKQVAQLEKERLSSIMETESLKSKLTESLAELQRARNEILKQKEKNNELSKRIDSMSDASGVRKDASGDANKGNP